MRTRVTVLGWINIIYNGFALLIGILLLLFMLGVGGAVTASGGHDSLPVLGIFGAVGMFIAGLIGMLSIPGLIAGIGLLNFAPWARVLTLVLSALDLFSFPFGTALGIYGFVVLCNQETAQLFERSGHPAY